MNAAAAAAADQRINDACESCRAPLIWAITPRGRRIPINAEPDPAGNVLLDRTSHALIAHVLGPGTAAHLRERGDQLHQTHFATCPDAGAYRRPRPARRHHR